MELNRPVPKALNIKIQLPIFISMTIRLHTVLKPDMAKVVQPKSQMHPAFVAFRPQRSIRIDRGVVFIDTFEWNRY